MTGTSGSRVFRRLLVIIAAVMLVGSIERSATAQDAAVEGASFRVVTFNIAAGRNADLLQVASVLDSLSADVVALQEVASNWEDVSRGVDQAEELARTLGMEAFYAPIYSIEVSESETRHFGLAVLTPHRIVRRANHLITRLSTQEENTAPQSMPGFPEVVVDIDGVPVRVLNTHLDYRRDPAVRAQQVDDMLRVAGELDSPTLLMGDLNARPDAPEIAPLLSAFKDAWTDENDPGYTGPTHSPDRRIDYVLVSPHCQVHQVLVHQSDVSDHFPVVADLTCTP